MITRKLLKLNVVWPSDDPSSVVVDTVALVTDDVEGTEAGKEKTWRAPSVVAAALALRDAILAQSAQQDKPYTL